MCTVSGIRVGTVSYCTVLERIGAVTTTFESCGSVGDGERPKHDLFSAEVELIFWFKQHTELLP
jgi:hypothetical protein